VAQDLLTQVLGDVGRRQGAGQAFAGEPDFLRGVFDLFAVTRHHGVDRGADLFSNAARRQRFGRRRVVESGESAFGRCAWWRDLFHVRHPRRLPVVRNAPRVMFCQLRNVGPALIEQKHHCRA